MELSKRAKDVEKENLVHQLWWSSCCENSNKGGLVIGGFLTRRGVRDSKGG